MCARRRAGSAGPRGDRDRVQQVLVNLLDNAIKYDDARRSSSRRSARTGVARRASRTRGSASRCAEQQRIFEKFYRSDPELIRLPAGTGLGLYISRELVKRMGGRLDVRSEPGAGATFVVELPSAEPDVVASMKRISP